MAIIKQNRIARRKRLPRGKTPRRQGKKGKAGEEARLQARIDYFEIHGRQEDPDDQMTWSAPCQVCGFPVYWHEADAAHKEKRSLKAGNEPWRLLVVHGHRLGPVNCHAWVDEEGKRERHQILAASPVNVVTGGKVEWLSQAEQLQQFLKAAPYSQRSVGE